MYIFCDSILFILLSGVLSIFVDLYAQVLGFLFQYNLFSEVSGFRKFAIKWSSDPHLKFVFGFQHLDLLRLLLELHKFKDDLL